MDFDEAGTDLQVALTEAVHRAQNDLAAVAAMLRFQANKTVDPAARTVLLDVESRVRALSRLNARLDARATGTATTLDIVDFLNGLAMDIRAMHLAQRPVTLDVRIEPHSLRLADAKPLGLIFNELVVNALKYAFPGGLGGTVFVVFRCRDGDCTLVVRDDGIGLDPAAPPRGTGVGQRMVQALAAKIGGSFKIGPGAKGGTECTVRWRPPPAPLDFVHVGLATPGRGTAASVGPV